MAIPSKAGRELLSGEGRPKESNPIGIEEAYEIARKKVEERHFRSLQALEEMRSAFLEETAGEMTAGERAKALKRAQEMAEQKLRDILSGPEYDAPEIEDIKLTGTDS